MKRTALELFEEGQECRRCRRFGDAINSFMAVMSADDADEGLKRRAAASIDLIQEINGFVNTDLMNP